MVAETLYSSSCFPCCSSNPQRTYDVFLSFRGMDTRKSFTDHLYAALDREGIFTFRDNEELERGQPISPNLLESIQVSRIALVVFSKNYASSSWCLDELAMIVDCMEETGQRVFPIFYDVHPSEIRRQTGRVEEAFVAHEELFKDDSDDKERVQKWRAALTRVANLSGFHLQDRHESVFIEEIIETVLKELSDAFSSLSKDVEPIGMRSRIEEIMKLFSSKGKENNVLFMGIWGMSGIGKTTLARAFYDKIFNQFQVRSFLENVREVSKRDGIHTLQKKLLLDFQMKTDTKMRDVRERTYEIKYRFRHKKALIILDDVDELEQLQGLAGSSNWFGQGSRIIITTKDEQLLISHGVDKRYKAKELSAHEALRLFSRKVFKNDNPPKDYRKLSRDFVNYAKGLPLAIEVLGPSLCDKSISEWESAFRRLTKNLEGKIMSPLLIGFDGLHEEEKEIFLDIACFFKGEEKDHVAKILESFGFEAIIGISRLLSKSLLTLVGSKLWMHDLLQEMGWEIVRRECLNEPGKRSRLWHSVDVLDVMTCNKGTDAVQGMVIILPKEESVELYSDSFSKLQKLRYLKISNVLLPKGLGYLSTELRALEWHGYPSKLLPKNFPSDKLVQLNMCGSHINHLWKGFKVLDNLKSIELNDSKSLIETPDFRGVANLERLILEGCTKLSKIHPSISYLQRLVVLNLRNCTSLEIISCDMSFKSLRVLTLSGCARLKTFPNIAGDMKCLSKIYLDETAIEELPVSIERLTGLTLLDLAHCKNLLRLPSVISSLTRFRKLILSGCSNLVEIPENIGRVECLEELDISGTAIRQLPSSIVFLKNLRVLSCSKCDAQLSTSLLFHSFATVPPRMGLLSPSSVSGFCSLTSLNLSYCNLFDGAIPNDLDHLSSLKKLDLTGNNFTSMPDSICRLSKLAKLYLDGCRQLQSLPKLPSSIEGIWVSDCMSLERDSDQYEVFDAAEKGMISIIKRTKSTVYLIQMRISQFTAWLRRYHEVNEVEISRPLRTAYGLSTRSYQIPNWFNIRSNSFSVTISLPAENESRPWMGYALYVDLEFHEDFDTSSAFKVEHKFNCYFDTMESAHDRQTLYHEVTIRDIIPFTGSHGYWIILPHLWFSARLNSSNDCSSIEAQSMIDDHSVEVKMTSARLLYQEDFIVFVHALKRNSRALRVEKNKSSSVTLSMLAEDGSYKIDSTVPLKDHLRSLPSDLQCYEGERFHQGGKYYIVRSRFTNPQSTPVLEEILQEYSDHHITYEKSFPVWEIPEWFCAVNDWSSVVSLDPMKSWKGIAVCAAFTVHRHPSLVLNNLDLKNPHIRCTFGNGNRKIPIHGYINATLSSLKDCGFIWICYASRGSFSHYLSLKSNECTSMKVRLYSYSEDITVQSCGHQFVYHENMEELMETITQCSTTSLSQSSKNTGRENNSPSLPKIEKEEHKYLEIIFLFLFFVLFLSLDAGSFLCFL